MLYPAVTVDWVDGVDNDWVLAVVDDFGPTAVEEHGPGSVRIFFASGDARVDPKKLLQTCRYCDLQTLCRVYERVNALTDEEGDAVD